MKISKILLGLFTLAAALPSQAQLIESYSSTPNLAIPDGNGAGISEWQLISASAIPAIGSLTVDLSIAGNFNGDLYVYLRHEAESSPGIFTSDSFAVLLNRPGRAAGLPSGYDDSGLNITLSDGALGGDVHSYRLAGTPSPGSPLTGTFEPDGREIDPTAVLDSTPRTALLDVFNGKSVNGRWTLFAADLQSGGASQLTGWELNFSSVPEPGAYVLITGLGLVAFGALRKRSQRRGPASPRL